MKVIFYSDDRCKHQAYGAIQAAEASGVEDTQLYNRDNLESFVFFDQYKHILNRDRGGGFWLWKSLLIRQNLLSLDPDEILCYSDCSDRFTGTTNTFFTEQMKDKDMLFIRSFFLNKEFTKRDCFVLMGCDEPKYWNDRQLEAGLCFFRNTPRSFTILDEWIKYGSDPHIITDDPNEFGENFPEFKDHRHDQSILSLLVTKYDLPTISQEFVNPKHINYNAA
jgi:hypothetical protein